MKQQIIQIFTSKATAFAWVMEMVQDCTIGDVNTNGLHLGKSAIICETEQHIFIGAY